MLFGNPLRLVGALVILTQVAISPLSGQNSSAVPQRDLIRPGDLVRLRIWREPDLSGEFVVDQSGTVVLPKLGRLALDGESSESLQSRLTTHYLQFLKDPSIEVTLLRRVKVIGAVQRPGLYPVDRTMTTSDVLALAGGANAQGDIRRVELTRDGHRLDATARDGHSAELLALQSGDELFVPERSWLERNSAVVAASVSSIVSLAIALFVRR